MIMKTAFIIAAMVTGFIASASAQQASPPQPIIIDPQTYQQLRQYLGQQPHDVVAPVVNLLQALQQQAQQHAATKAVEEKPAQ